MFPFLKASAEINAQKAKALEEDAKRMQQPLFAANDDKYFNNYFDEEEVTAANE